MTTTTATAKWHKSNLELDYRESGKGITPGYTSLDAPGLYVHKEHTLLAGQKMAVESGTWRVSHIQSGLCIIKYISKLSSAKVAALRLADIHDWNQPMTPADATPELGEKVRAVKNDYMFR